MSEFDHAPLMRHETGLTGTGFDNVSSAVHSDLAPAYFRKEEGTSYDGYGCLDDGPLLSHERRSAVGMTAGDESVMRTGQLPAFTYQPPKNTRALFAERTSSPIWKARSTFSSLPHSLPRSDAEDENLHDASLEDFPTQRQRIMERVATIHSRMPEDDSVRSPSDTHSPELNILSQACSSVDLAPSNIGSHTSLHRIAEDALSETEEDNDSALGSPVMELSFRVGAGTSSGVSASKDVVREDEMSTPMPQAKRGEYFNDDKAQNQSGPTTKGTHDGSQELSVVASVQKNDGAGDSAPAAALRWTPDDIARPATALDPILTAPKTTWERTRAQTNDRVATVAKGSARIQFADPTQGEDREDSPLAPHPNIFVRAWHKLKVNFA